MSRYIQRYPLMPKGTLWKRYTGLESVGKRTIYVATDKIGFEVEPFPKTFIKRILASGKYECNYNVEYVSITNIQNGQITPNKTLYLKGNYYLFNSITETMEVQDIADEDLEIISAVASNVYIREKNVYVRQVRFDCIKENDQQTAMYQPIQGLMTGSSYLTLKTHNFCDSKVKPECDDLIYYQNYFWSIVDIRETYLYTPREQVVLHLTVKKIAK